MIRILYADDDPDDQQLFKELILESVPVADVQTVDNGVELMEALFGMPVHRFPDVIFLDINMPLKNGIECLRELRADRLYIQIPVIMFSTAFAKGQVEKSYAEGASLYIEKSLFFLYPNQVLEIIFDGDWKKRLQERTRNNYVFKLDPPALFGKNGD